MPSHKLTDAEKELIAQIRIELNNLQQQLNGALRMALKTRSLSGDWELVGDELMEKTRNPDA